MSLGIESVEDGHIYGSASKPRSKRLDLMKHLNDNHLIKRLAKSVAVNAQMPASSTFLAALSTVSSILCRDYETCYQDGKGIPLGLYAVIEQPSGTGKSRCVGVFQEPVFDVEAKVEKEKISKLMRLGEDEQSSDEDKKEKKEIELWLKEKPAFFTTNATPEALEQSLFYTNGYFSLVSAEQGLFNSMFGASYRADGGAGNNNDLILHSYLGEKFSTLRVSRANFSGKGVGAICLFSQEGSVETLLAASGMAGLMERFLLLSEGHNIGFRRFKGITPIDKGALREYDSIIKPIVERVLNKGMNDEDKGGLSRVACSDNGYNIINEYREGLEHNLRGGGVLAVHPVIRGAGVKVDIAIYKVAAILHIMGRGNGMDSIISDDNVRAAIGVVNDLLFNLLSMLETKEIAGLSVEQEVILKVFENDNRPKTERQIIMNRRRVAPFKNMDKNSAKIREVLHSLVTSHQLSIDRDTATNGKTVCTYRLTD